MSVSGSRCRQRWTRSMQNRREEGKTVLLNGGREPPAQIIPGSTSITWRQSEAREGCGFVSKCQLCGAPQPASRSRMSPQGSGARVTVHHPLHSPSSPPILSYSQLVPLQPRAKCPREDSSSHHLRALLRRRAPGTPAGASHDATETSQRRQF